MDSASHEASAGAAPPADRNYIEVQRSAEFVALRRAHRSFAFPLTVAFISWYFLYVLLSIYAGALMGTKIVGNINVAFVFGVAQFVTTFAIAWWYSRHAAAKLDPAADAIKSRLEGGA
ncbi:DUF485 domain-containing protein [Streptomyces sp. RKND-216]|uniref:DUF485 domain-containing protein n=1 Tax=Streptomyces sp. RKND-216 TaxID=2562581 RepID=UPI000412CC80|nr:DUF485 domain-containing protein [Streptomyces sp. RKND-216]